MNYKISKGNFEKIGVTLDRGGVIFTFAGEKEDACFVVLVDRNSRERTRVAVPDDYCLGSLRSIRIEGIRLKDTLYYYEVNGSKVLDVYARAIEGRDVWNDVERAKKQYEILDGFDAYPFDWKEDKNPEISKDQMILYKLHVRGFSMASGKKTGNGTFQAVKNRIPYFKKLGITTLEFMPVYEFEEMDIPKIVDLPDYVQWKEDSIDEIKPEPIVTTSGKVNYWGYGEGDYFAVKASYATKPNQASYEFRSLVHKLHENGMECVMEMFFPASVNHNMVIDALRFWVREYHVDGFHLLGENLPITAICQDIFLSRTKIFYMDYDSNQISADRRYQNLYVYKEEYQFPARKILNHMNADMREFSDQQRKQGEHLGYVNFIASNNGFSLADVFSYNDKHNEANGENNLDGEYWNFSNNHGYEGATKKKYVNNIRKQKWRNAMVMLMMAQGVPMIWQGDEISNSQDGNNNTYCQDNETGWVDWKQERKHKNDLVFLEKLVSFRKDHTILTQPQPYQFHDYGNKGLPDLSYHGESAWLLDIERGRMNLGTLYYGPYASGDNKESVYVAYNFFSAASTLALPKLPKKKWYQVLDTSVEASPFLEEPKLVEGNSFVVKPQSIVILISK